MSQRTNQRRKRKSIDKDTEIVIANNTYGMFVWESRNGEISIELNEHGDEEYVSYRELRQLKKYLSNMKLIITSVNDDDVSIMDVARGLRIDDVYLEYFDLVEELNEEEANEKDEIVIDDFEDFIIDSDVDEFEKALKSQMRPTIINTSVELYKTGQLVNRDKTKLIQKTRPKDVREDFWSDIEATFDEDR